MLKLQTVNYLLWMVITGLKLRSIYGAVLTYKKLICHTNTTVLNLFLPLFYLQYIQLMLPTTEIIVMHTPTLYTRYM